MDRLFINDIEADLGKQNFALNKQSNDLDSLMQKQGDTTQQLTIPLTENNKKIFGDAHLMVSGTKLPYKAMSARLIRNGFDILSNGRCILNSASEKGYTIQLVGGNMDLFKQIEGKNIRDLDLSVYDHDWTFANIVSSWSNTEGYIYPAIDWSEDGGSMGPDFAESTKQLPCVFQKTILEKIITEAGFSFAGNFFGSDSHAKAIVGFGLDDLKYPKEEELKNGSNAGADLSILQSVGTPDTILTGEGTVISSTAILFTDFSPPYTPTPNISNGIWRCPVSGEYDIKINLSFKSEYIYLPFIKPTLPQSEIDILTLSIKIRVIAGFIELPSQTFNINATDFKNKVVNNYSYSGTKIYMAKNDTLIIFAECNLYYKNSLKPFSFQTKINSGSLDITGGGTVGYGSKIFLSKILPDISQSDFLKQIIIDNCLLPSSDSDKKIFNLNYFSTVIKNIPYADDYSDYLVNDSQEISFRFGRYAQKNKFVFQKDETIKDDTFGQGIFYIADENLPIELPVLSSLYSPTESRNFDTYKINIVRKYSGAEIKNKTGKKILYLERVNKSIKYLINGVSQGVQVGVPITSFRDGNYLLSNNYFELTSLLNDFKAIRLNMRIPTDVFIKRDTLTPIYVKKFCNNFYENKISGYDKDGFCTIEIIRI